MLVLNDVKLECVYENFGSYRKSEKQCSAAVMKANRMLGMIKRNFADRSKETIMPLRLCKVGWKLVTHIQNKFWSYTVFCLVPCPIFSIH